MRLHGGRARFGARELLLIIPMPRIDSMPASDNFTALAAELSPMLLRYLRRYVGDPSLADDFLQETLVRMERGLAGFEQRASVKTWAFSIASRVTPCGLGLSGSSTDSKQSSR